MNKEPNAQRAQEKEPEYLLRMQGIVKEFSGVQALKGVDFCVRPGTVHALMGENGAGKSTLMKCLFGIYHKDAGRIWLNGQEVDFRSPHEALMNGISMVHQELEQVRDRNVMENVWMELTNGVGADEVMECSGAKDSPLKACRMVKKTGAIAIIATYHDELVPIPANTVNFNEIRIVGSKANPNVSDKVLHFFSTGAIQGDKLITHKFPLEDYEKAVDLFEHKRDGSIKVVINP